MMWEKPLGKRKDSKAVMMSPVRKVKDNGKRARMELETLKKYPDCEKFSRTLVGRRWTSKTAVVFRNPEIKKLKRHVRSQTPCTGHYDIMCIVRDSWSRPDARRSYTCGSFHLLYLPNGDAIPTGLRILLLRLPATFQQFRDSEFVFLCLFLS